MHTPIRILIADDHGLLRAGLRSLLDDQPDLTVVAEVDGAGHIVETTTDNEVDVALLDWNMPDGGGLRALRDLSAAGSQVRRLVVTMHRDPSFVNDALQAGAHGYLLKDAAGEQLLRAVRSVAEGRVYLDPRIEDMSWDDPTPADAVPSLEQLSRRETQVLRFVARGHTNQQTAEALDLSVKTVEGYRARVMRKLDANSRVDLVRHALRFGLLDAADAP